MIDAERHEARQSSTLARSLDTLDLLFAAGWISRAQFVALAEEERAEAARRSGATLAKAELTP